MSVCECAALERKELHTQNSCFFWWTRNFCRPHQFCDQTCRHNCALQWYCGYPKLKECHTPETLPWTPLGIGDLPVQTGLGRSIYTKEQMEDFFYFSACSWGQICFSGPANWTSLFMTRQFWRMGLGCGSKSPTNVDRSSGHGFCPTVPVFMIVSHFFDIGDLFPRSF